MKNIICSILILLTVSLYGQDNPLVPTVNDTEAKTLDVLSFTVHAADVFLLDINNPRGGYWTSTMTNQLSNPIYLRGFGVDIETLRRANRPPLSLLRVAGELVQGFLFLDLVVGSMEGWSSGLGWSAGHPNPAPGPTWQAGFVVCLSSFAVCQVGNIGDETGSFLVTVVSGLAGFLLGGGFKNDTSVYTMISGATIGFNLTRRYDTQVAVSVNHGQLRFALPIIAFTQDPFYGTARTLDLVRIDF